MKTRRKIVKITCMAVLSLVLLCSTFVSKDAYAITLDLTIDTGDTVVNKDEYASYEEGVVEHFYQQDFIMSMRMDSDPYTLYAKCVYCNSSISAELVFPEYDDEELKAYNFTEDLFTERIHINDIDWDYGWEDGCELSIEYKFISQTDYIAVYNVKLVCKSGDTTFSTESKKINVIMPYMVLEYAIDDYTLAAGAYKLTKDLVIGGILNINGDCSINLNGHNIDGSIYCKGHNITIYDDSENNGTITSSMENASYVISIEEGSLSLKNINVCGCAGNGIYSSGIWPSYYNGIGYGNIKGADVYLENTNIYGNETGLYAGERSRIHFLDGVRLYDNASCDLCVRNDRLGCELYFETEDEDLKLNILTDESTFPTADKALEVYTSKSLDWVVSTFTRADGGQLIRDYKANLSAVYFLSTDKRTSHSYSDWTIEGNVATATCNLCGETHSVEFVINYDDPEKQLIYDADKLSEIIYLDTSDWDTELGPELSLQFKDKYEIYNSTEYPTDYGTYTVSVNGIPNFPTYTFTISDGTEEASDERKHTAVNNGNGTASKNGITYTILTDGGSLSAGNYILMSDIHLTKPLSLTWQTVYVKYSDGRIVIPDMDVTIELNGYYIIGDQLADSNLVNIYCDTYGVSCGISFTNDEGAGGGIKTSDKCLINTYGGYVNIKNIQLCDAELYAVSSSNAKITIDGDTEIFNCNGGGMRAASGSITMHSGSIHDNGVGKAGVSVNGSTFNMDGFSSIYNNTKGIEVNGGGCNVSGFSSITGNNEGIEVNGGGGCNISGTVTISENSKGVVINKGSFTISGESVITGNNWGVNAVNASSFTARGNSVIAGNSDLDVRVYNGQSVNIGGEAVVSFTVSNPGYNASDMEFLVSDAYRGIENYLIARNPSTAMYMESYQVSGNEVIVRTVNCAVHNYAYTSDGNTISADCLTCYTNSSVSFTMADFDSEEDFGYYEGQDISKLILLNDEAWDEDHGPYPSLVYGYVDPDSGNITYSTKAPTQIGLYTVKLAVCTKKGDISTQKWATEERYFAIISEDECEEHNIYFIGEHDCLTLRCLDCGRLVSSAKIRDNNHDLEDCIVEDGYIMLPICCGDELEILYDDDWFEYGEELCIVYGSATEENPELTIEVPTQPGRYFAYLALLPDINAPEEAIAATEKIYVEVTDHEWEYSSGEDYISATCKYCGEEASVHICVAGAMDSSRNYDDESEEEYFEYELVEQENWIGQRGIEQYYILYDGVAVSDEFNSTYKDSVFIKPTISGSYTARVVLLSDVSDPDSAYLSSGEVPYYLAGIPIGDPYIKFADYSEDQYKLLEEPQREMITFTTEEYELVKNGDLGTVDCYAFISETEAEAYIVDSFEDLMWCVRYAPSNAVISIEKDIIVNPIAITEDGKTVRVGSNVIYNWYGFGTYRDFTGTIVGNGHTIYGLYLDDASSLRAGFISTGCNAKVVNLTISDSYLHSGGESGGIAGRLVSNAYQGDGESIGNVAIVNCKVLNSNISTGNKQSYYAGGIVGHIWVNSGKRVTINDCAVSGRIEGSCSGGMIGLYYNAEGKYNSNSDMLTLRIFNCVNTADVYSDVKSWAAAGGILGCYWEEGGSYTTLCMYNCGNAGSIEGYYCAGGIIGDARNLRTGSSMDNCKSAGIISSTSKDGYPGGLVGYDSNGNFQTFTGNMYYAKAAVGKLDSGTVASSVYANATELTKKDLELSLLCDTADGVCHTTSNEWTIETAADCEHKGLIVKKCLVCGEVAESKVVSAYGHSFAFGDCINCGLSEEEVRQNQENRDNQTGSIFSELSPGVYIFAAIIVVGVVAAVIIKKRKNI